MENNYPQTRAAKIALIKRMLNGELTISDVRDQGYHVTMWRQDPRDPDSLENFDGSERISRADFEKRAGLHVTLTIE